ncbi:MAG: ABC transporter permease [Verrucomicrobia bacterium]|nr:ABC transporter permease [Verrucomicrobiota bacterium]
MMRYVFKRLIEMVPVMLIVVTATFFLAHAVPGGPFDKERPLPAEVKARLEEYYGLDRPIYVQWWNYVSRLAQGDLGPSLKYPGWTVNEVIGSRIPVSISLGLVALLLAILIGVPVGVLAAVRPNSWLDRVPMGFSLIGICVPSFVLGPLFALVFSLGLGWVPPCGWGSAIHFILPACTLGLITAAPLARLTRGSMMEVRSLDYVRTAYAKGVPPLRVWFVHALRNALLPVITYLGPAAAALVSGSFVVESLFDVPGLGRLFVSAIINRDVTLILGTTIIYAVALLVLNLLADLTNAALNPRIARAR